MKTSEKFEALLCNPDGEVCIHGSDEDRKILTEAIAEVRALEELRDGVKDRIQTISNSEWDGNINHFTKSVCDGLTALLRGEPKPEHSIDKESPEKPA